MGSKEDSTNNFRFVNCHWELVHSYAIYAERKEEFPPQGRTRISNCKFHGHPPDSKETFPNVYYIDGDFSGLQISNSYFQWNVKKGYVRNQGFNTTQISNCNFRNYADACIKGTKDTHAVYVANSSFFTAFTSGYAIDLQGGTATVHGNIINSGLDTDVDADLVVAGDQVTVIGNVLYSSTGDGILVDGPSQSVSVIGNSVNGSDNSGIHLIDTQHSTVIGNTVREAGEYGILSEGSSDYLAVSANVITNTGAEAVTLVNSNNQTNGENIMQ